MIKHLFSAAALLLAATAGVSNLQAQAAGPFVKITDIKLTLEKTPEFSIGVGPQRKAPSQDWLWVEVTFITARNSPALDDLTLNYYILLNNPSPQNRTGTLLTGTVTHTGIVAGPGEHRSLMLVSPQTLRRFFDGKLPTNANTAVQAVGVTATIQGQIQSELSTDKGRGKPQWWTALQQGPAGQVLSKDQSPFAPLFYDYFEATKVKPAGGY